MRLAIVCTVLCLAAATAGASDVYQWTDARGVTHYSETPPPAEPEVNPQCAAAQANIEVLQGEGPVFQEDSDGERVALGDEDRGRQLELAQAALRAYCNTAD